MIHHQVGNYITLNQGRGGGGDKKEQYLPPPQKKSQNNIAPINIALVILD
jgi:hypothetical protein